jgi:hypothetical protein
MKKLVLGMMLLSSTAMADYQLAKNGKKVVCFAEDNVSFTLNAARTNVKYETEGESLGAKKITKVVTNRSSYVAYTTSELTLKLSNKGDTVQLKGEDEAYPVDCQ